MADPHDARVAQLQSQAAPKKRRLELDGLKFDNPGAAFDFQVDSSKGRPARRAASINHSARASPAVAPPPPIAAPAPASGSGDVANHEAAASSSSISKRQRRPSHKLRDDWDGLVINSSSPPSSSSPRRPPASASSSSQPVAGPSSQGQRQPPRGVLDRLQQDLDDIHCEHDDMVRELFHLTKFVTLVGFDPAVAKQDKSHVFEHFRAEHGLDLESKLATSSRRATRRIVSSRMDDLSLRKARPSDVKGKAKEEPTPPPTSKKQPRRSSPLRGSEEPKRRKKSTKNSIQEDSDDEAHLLQLWQRRQRPRELPAVPPLLAATSYKQIPEPYDFGSLDAFWQSFRILGEDERQDWDLQEAEEWEQREAALYARIDAARAEGRLRDQPASHGVLRSLKEPLAPSSSHVDHISQHASAIRSEAKQRRALARKASRAIQSYWQSRLGEGERERKAQERHLRTLARWTAREVNKQWKLAISVVRAQRAKQEKLERERAGREQLSKILERSTQYLGQREEDLRQGRILSEAGSEDEEEEAATESDVYSVEDDGSGASRGDDDDDESVDEERQIASRASSRSDTNHLASLLDVSVHAASDGGEEAHRHRSLRRLIEDASGESSRSSRERSSPPTSVGRPPAAPASPPAIESIFSPTGTRFGKRSTNGTNGPLHGLVEVAQSDDERQLSDGNWIGDGPDDYDAPKQNGAAHASSVASPPSPASPASDASMSDADVDDDDQDDRTREDAQLEQDMRAEDEEDESEDEGLLADADMPIEELMKRYGYGSAAQGQGDEGDAEGDSQSSYESESDADAGSQGSGESEAGVEEITGINGAASFFSRASSSRAASQGAASAPLAKAGGTSTPTTAPALHQPFLLRGSLRPYQQTGFEWLASLYANSANGILADEMGLGKTIQTISLLAHLACDRGVWGPHLVIAPTSVMLNWEVEFKKFLPGFKILSYYGSQRERKEKRIGWNTEHSKCATA